MSDEYGKIVQTQYVAMYKGYSKGQDYFKCISLGYPRWLIPPPTIDMIEQDFFKRDGKNMVVTFVRADTQAEIGKAFGIPQQAVSRYMKNTNPFETQASQTHPEETIKK